MKLGFTGTRDGLTVEQHRSLLTWMRANKFTEFHHGCCIGADSEAFDIASSHTGHEPKPKCVAHPPTNRRLVSGTTIMFTDEKREPLPYLERNRAIVNETEKLLVCPKESKDERLYADPPIRSGTWSTLRYAMKIDRPFVVFWPDGTIDE